MCIYILIIYFLIELFFFIFYRVHILLTIFINRYHSSYVSYLILLGLTLLTCYNTLRCAG